MKKPVVRVKRRFDFKIFTLPLECIQRGVVPLLWLACVPAANAELRLSGNGSGFFVTKEGHFVTNEHVVRGADGLAVRCGDKTFKAEVLKIDAQNDIAILKVEGEFSSLPLGGDLDVRPGQDVFTIGFPQIGDLGIAPKTTLGSISALSGYHDDVRMFQTSVQIQPGNSGGPLVIKSTGNVIGVTSSTYVNGQNVNYAMKASYIRPLLSTIPGIGIKLAVPNADQLPWEDVQKHVENCVGLVLLLKEISDVEPPAMPAPPREEPPVAREGPWLFPHSSTRLLTRNELSNLEGDELWRARNEIYARNGLIFSTERGRRFTASLGGHYQGISKDQNQISKRMNAIENANLELIQRAEGK